MKATPKFRPQPPERTGLPHRCRIKLQGIYPSLKNAERRAANYLLAHGEVVDGLSIIDFADRAGCSEATAVRLARKLGYGGYPELKRAFAGNAAAVPYPDLSAHEPPEEVAAKVFQSSIQALKDTLEVIDLVQYRAATEALLRAQRVAFIGLGNAAVVAREAYLKFLRLGVPSYTAEDPDLQIIIATTQLEAGDLLTCISYSGESKPILAAAQKARARGVTILAIANFPRSTLARMADVVLLTAVFQEQVNGEIAAQRLTQLCVLESLYVNFLLRRGGPVQERLMASNAAVAVNKRSRPPKRQPS